jgi:hypothetical protein
LTTSQPNYNEGTKDRRRTARFPFVANAELTDSTSGTPIYARVTEISMYGCYLDMTHPLPVGTQAFVKIFTDTDFFESTATVVYSQPNLGLGLAFSDVGWQFLPTMHKWFLGAMRAATVTNEKS